MAKKIGAISQPFFVLEENFRKATPKKIGKIIRVFKVNLYSKKKFYPLYSKNKIQENKKKNDSAKKG